MNRREALKKLGAGTAIAAGGSLVLSSNAVAQTASGNVPDIPAANEPLDPTVTLTGFPVQVEFAAPAFLTCSGTGSPTTTYSWRIASYTITGFLAGLSQLRIVNQSGGVVVPGTTVGSSCTSGCGNGPGYFTSTNRFVRVERSILGIFDGSFQNGDSVIIELLVVTSCPGGPTISAEYRYDSSNGLDSPMENFSYTVTPPSP
jgi:hypothetical protein